jgi:hypothetical protein
MARALDAGSGDAFTGRTSELRGKEKDSQPDKVGFKQVMSSLVVEDALANGLETTNACFASSTSHQRIRSSADTVTTSGIAPACGEKNHTHQGLMQRNPHRTLRAWAARTNFETPRRSKGVALGPARRLSE